MSIPPKQIGWSTESNLLWQVAKGLDKLLNTTGAGVSNIVALLNTKVTNELGVPSFYANTFANLPAPGVVGRMFVSTDTFAIYRDNGTGWNLIGGPGTGSITGTGVAGQIVFWNGTSTQSGDNGLFWDDVNKRLGVGLTNPAQSLEVNGTSRFRSNIEVLNTRRIINVNSGGSIRFNTGGSITIANTANIDYVRFDAGNVIIQNGGTFVDAGFRLDVNGTARVQGAMTVGNGTDSIIVANSSSSNNFNKVTFIANTTDNSTVLEITPNGNNTNLTGLVLRDSSTNVYGSNQVFFGRGNITVPSTGVAYFGASVSQIINANSFHLGFIVSNTSLGRFEAMRMFNSGNILFQSGGTYTDNSSALVTINSTTKGFLPPRMTGAQAEAISSPATGLLVYATTGNGVTINSEGWWGRTSTTWVRLN